MEIFILDELFRSLYNIDAFESLIWTERYNGCGNFEFYTPVNLTILQVVRTIRMKMGSKLDCYAWLKETGTVMVIEDLEITTNVETGNHLVVSGRGLESLLERRIVWEQTSVNGTLQNGIQKLINDAIINPKITDRKIPNFKFSVSSDPYINSLKLRAQYTGNNLYNAILAICDEYQLGFDVNLDENNDFVFTLTNGVDRSYDQETVPYIIFSPKYENIINSDYLESTKTLKNVTLVAGEDHGLNRKTRVIGSASGLTRRELYTDARDIQSEGYNTELDSDKDKLNGYKQDLASVQQALSDETEEFTKETAEYNKKKSESDTKIVNHQNRISALNQRISYHNQQITSYYNGLTDDQKNSYNARTQYKAQIENYENLINGCSDRINDYNDKLKNEETLTYSKVVQYEQAIDAEEAQKKTYETAKKPIEDSKKEAEDNLPNYETTLKDYEDKISKYEEIVEDDQKSITDETESFSKETTEYNQKKSEYEQKKAAYESQIASLSQTIASLEVKIADAQNELTIYYNELLDQRGNEKLSENAYISVFTGEIEATKTFVYDKDFFKGDIVQIVNEYNMESKVRVSEVVRVQDTSGYSMYPTFQVIE